MAFDNSTVQHFSTFYHIFLSQVLSFFTFLLHFQSCIPCINKQVLHIELWHWPAYHNWLQNKNNWRLTSYLKGSLDNMLVSHLNSYIDIYVICIQRRHLCVKLLFKPEKCPKYYRYYTTSSTDMFYNKCNIIVLIQNKSINNSIYVWICGNQVNR